MDQNKHSPGSTRNCSALSKWTYWPMSDTRPVQRVSATQNNRTMDTRTPSQRCNPMHARSNVHFSSKHQSGKDLRYSADRAYMTYSLYVAWSCWLAKVCFDSVFVGWTWLQDFVGPFRFVFCGKRRPKGLIGFLRQGGPLHQLTTWPILYNLLSLMNVLTTWETKLRKAPGSV
jgi:hypothetical protein